MDQRTDIGNLSNFSRGLLDLLDRVEYRRIVTSEDMETVGVLRSRSYARSGIFEKQYIGSSFVEDSDFDPAVYVFGVYVDEQLLSTLRVHRVTRENRSASSARLFPDVLDPMLDRGMTFIDPERFAVDADFSDDFPGLPYLTLRIATMASVYFNVDGCLACCVPSHSAFYKRVFGFNQLVEPRIPEGVCVPVCLMMENISNRIDVARRYPVFKSHPYEQRLMFDRTLDHGLAPLSILPTARYADAVRRPMPMSLFAS